MTKLVSLLSGARPRLFHLPIVLALLFVVGGLQFLAYRSEVLRSAGEVIWEGTCAVSEYKPGDRRGIDLALDCGGHQETYTAPATLIIEALSAGRQPVVACKHLRKQVLLATAETWVCEP